MSAFTCWFIYAALVGFVICGFVVLLNFVATFFNNPDETQKEIDES